MLTCTSIRSTSAPRVVGNSPVATIKAYQRKGRAIVTIEREGRPTHRYRVGLMRYYMLRHWLERSAGRRWRTSGAWARSSVTISLWPVDNSRWACTAAHALVSRESY